MQYDEEPLIQLTLTTIAAKVSAVTCLLGLWGWILVGLATLLNTVLGAELICGKEVLRWTLYGAPVALLITLLVGHCPQK